MRPPSLIALPLRYERSSCPSNKKSQGHSHIIPPLPRAPPGPNKRKRNNAKQVSIVPAAICLGKVKIMNFVAQVEDHLRDLGAEARKNHPGRICLMSSEMYPFSLLIPAHYSLDPPRAQE